MNHLSKQLVTTYGTNRIAYYRLGNGKQWAVCFHGYGQSGTVFNCFTPAIAASYTFIVIELPHHGHTEWVQHLPMQPTDLMQIIESIIPPKTVFTLIGYSMGARIALCLLQQYPKSINQIILLAPDGVHNNVWQWLSTQTNFGNQLFKYFMLQVNWLPWLVTQLGNCRLLNPSITRFVLFSIATKPLRSLLFHRWTTMRLFWPNQQRLQHVAKQYAIPITCFLGLHDRVIPAATNARRLLSLFPYAHIQYVPAGHQILKPAFVPQIVAALLH